MMLSCKEAMRLASESLDRPLSLRTRIGLRMHVFMCSSCRAASRQMRALDSLIGGRFTHEAESETDVTSSPPDPAARDRVRKAVHKVLDQED